MSELGKTLKEAREEKGMSLEDVQAVTKIQKRYLQGIEEGNYSMMPGKFYVRAFMKQYAEAVGLNAEELFEHYKQEIPESVSEQLPDQLSRVQSKKSTINVSNSKVFEMLPKVLIGVFMIGAVALVYYFVMLNAEKEKENELVTENQTVNIEDADKLNEEPKNGSKDQEKDPESGSKKDDKSDSNVDVEEVDKPEEVNTTQEITMVTANGSKTTYELKNADKFEVKVATSGETWINMKNGKGTSFFQGMLKKGATESHTFDFSKETEAVLVIGRATEAQIFVNDQPVAYTVAPTEEVRQDITIRYVPKSE